MIEKVKKIPEKQTQSDKKYTFLHLDSCYRM